MAQQRRGGFKRRKKVDYSNNSYQTRSRNGFDAFRK